MSNPRHSNKRLIAGLVFALLPQTALAQGLLNGDFEDPDGGLTFWERIVGNVGVSNGASSYGSVPSGFGDANGDGRVSLADAGMIQACFAGIDVDHAGGSTCATIDLTGPNATTHVLVQDDVQAFFDQFEVQPLGANHVLLLRESSFGGISRVSQQFAVPTDPSVLSFQYRFVSRGGPTNSVPPDSFEVYLTDTDGNRLVIGTSAPPAYTFATFGSRAFFYVDSDSAPPYDLGNPGDTEDELEFDSTNVFVSRESAEGFRTVAMDISSLTPGTNVLLEFGLTSGRNNVTTYAAVDNVQLGCGTAYGYCCDASGNITFLDDGDPCTDDECDENGVPEHTAMTHCLECINPDGNTDILFMIDVSRNLPYWFEDLQDPANPQGVPVYDTLGAIETGIRTIMDLYGPYTGRPAIGIGRFGTKVGADLHAVIDQTPTTDYAAARIVLASLEHTGKFTPLAAGIDVAAAELEDAVTRRRYIVLLTDGFANIPPGLGEGCVWVSDCDEPTVAPGQCACEISRNAVNIAAHDARVNKGIRIYAKLFYSTSYGACDDDYDHPGNVNDNYCIRDWMINNVVSGEQAFFGTAGDTDPSGRECPECYAEITPDLVELIQVIECDDGNPCTLDKCVDGKCVHIKIYGCGD